MYIYTPIYIYRHCFPTNFSSYIWWCGIWSVWKRNSGWNAISTCLCISAFLLVLVDSIGIFLSFSFLLWNRIFTLIFSLKSSQPLKLTSSVVEITLDSSKCLFFLDIIYGFALPLTTLKGFWGLGLYPLEVVTCLLCWWSYYERMAGHHEAP